MRYLDNSDVNDDEHRRAEKTLLKAASTIEYFNDFYPFYFGVNQGVLVRV